ncbi:hypothetical protein F4803DRAFT_507357 [Xylaria telfairii]|nr:hypothetical protein F4803DRAFT_507357 [Xylaria telfairii]
MLTVQVQACRWGRWWMSMHTVLLLGRLKSQGSLVGASARGNKRVPQWLASTLRMEASGGVVVVIGGVMDGGRQDQDRDQTKNCERVDREYLITSSRSKVATAA